MASSTTEASAAASTSRKTDADSDEIQVVPYESESDPAVQEADRGKITPVVPQTKLTAAIKHNKSLLLRLQQQEQVQSQDHQSKTQAAALPFVTTGVLNCTLIANNIDDLANSIDKDEFRTGRQIMLLLVILLLLVVQFGIVGVLSYLFYVGSKATTISEDYLEGGLDKVLFEKESRRLRRLRNVLHAVMLILALNASVLEVIYLTLGKNY